MSEPPADDRPLPDAIGGIGVVVFCLVAILSAMIEVLLVPVYIGGAIFPVTVLIAVVVNVALPRLVRVMVDWRWAIALPMVAWVVTVIVLGYANSGSGSVLVPGYGQGQYVALALFFVGTLAGFISVIRERSSVPLAAPAGTVRSTASGRR
jgi:hypothetical protein